MTPTITLLQGDCLDLMAQIPDGSVDMVMADLPYGTTQNKWDSVIPLDALWAHYRRVCKPAAAIVLTAQTPFDKVLGISNLAMLKYEWIWEKSVATGFLNAKIAPMKCHENALVFYDKPCVYNPQMRTGFRPYIAKQGRKSSNYGSMSPDHVTVNDGCRYPVSIIGFDGDTGLHPTQKPVALMEYLIRTYTNEGATVLDNTMGSGTTGVACVNLARSFIGIERDPDYFKIASERIALAQNPVQARLL